MRPIRTVCGCTDNYIYELVVNSYNLGLREYDTGDTGTPTDTSGYNCAFVCQNATTGAVYIFATWYESWQYNMEQVDIIQINEDLSSPQPVVSSLDTPAVASGMNLWSAPTGNTAVCDGDFIHIEDLWNSGEILSFYINCENAPLRSQWFGSNQWNQTHFTPVFAPETHKMYFCPDDEQTSSFMDFVEMDTLTRAMTSRTFLGLEKIVDVNDRYLLYEFSRIDMDRINRRAFTGNVHNYNLFENDVFAGYDLTTGRITFFKMNYDTFEIFGLNPVQGGS
jgi:hypothetical protein